MTRDVMGLLDPFRRGRPRESTRRLALDVAVRATELTSREAPAHWDQLTTHELLESARGSLTDAARALEVERQRSAALLEELAAASRPARPSDGPVHRASPPLIVPELIEVADRLAVLDEDDPAYGSAVTRWLESRFVGMLARCEVFVIREDGPVNPSRHEVVDVRPAPDEEHADHIAATVRPGYAWRDQILRAQQVVAYTREDGR
jgi:hypothetical protein